MDPVFDLIVLGGGAAGFFGAIRYKELLPDHRVLILERGKKLLEKVKISGGGRCNVTHACFDPHALVTYYPRGEQELLGPFNRFHCSDTIHWFLEHGVKLVTEPDGRVFPATNQSATVINCFLNQAKDLNILIHTQQRVDQFSSGPDHWNINCGATKYSARKIMVCTGSSPDIWSQLAKLGHRIVPPVPSLFTFRSDTCTLADLAGVSFRGVSLSAEDLKGEMSGPLLITHQGVSGPAVLKLSAWGARELAQVNYRFTLKINWVEKPMDEVLKVVDDLSRVNPEKQLSTIVPFDNPGRWWKQWLDCHQFDGKLKWKQLTPKQKHRLASLLTSDNLSIHGKNTHKEEFVTAGGVDLKEVNTRTFESKLHPTLYFAGEVLNIDALTGGFNFQAAWTTSWLAATAAAQLPKK